MNHGQGERNQENTEIKWLMSFEPPYFFEKNLHLKFALINNGTVEEGEIAFTLSREKAMGHTLKKNINQVFKAHDAHIRIESILASPTSTLIKGNIRNTFELVKDQLSGERLRPGNLTLKLIANGQEVTPQGGGMSTDLKGITFQHSYDALPADLKTLQIRLESFTADHDVKQQISLKKDMKDRVIWILGQDLMINKIEESNNNTYLTITTEEGTVLTRVHLLMDAKEVKLEETIDDHYDKLPDGKIMHTRTLRFPGTGEDLRLDIIRMTYLETYQKTIDIPLD